MKECYLYDKKENNIVRCNACSHRCIIAEGNRGLCGVRKNIKGKLYSLVYGKAIGIAVDSIEKKPLFHFMPGADVLSFGTSGCNFGCRFCQNSEMSQPPREKIRGKDNIRGKNNISEYGIYGQDITPEEIVRLAVDNNIPCIAYTYNEPAVFLEFAYDTAKLAHSSKLSDGNNIKNIYVTNGYETKEALEMIKPYIDAINIDLKSFNDDFYKKLCDGRLQPVLDTIKRAHEMGFWIEITTLIIPGKNDSAAELKKIAEFIASLENNSNGVSGKHIPWHISRFFPMYKMLDVQPTPEKKLLEAYEIGKKAGLRHVYVGNIDIEGKENLGCSYCPECDELLIERKRYEIGKNNIKDGKCRRCKAKISGFYPFSRVSNLFRKYFNR
ncbi:MAG: AmmeMemoRadiSam system radical SAM enzyme [Candidatus Woesearchaeota archaeon]